MARVMTSLLDLIALDVALRKAGREFVGLCPFHVEKTPSFYVNEEKGVYLCRGCGAAGDAITYLRQTRGLSFHEAAQALGTDLADTDIARAARKREARDRLLARFFAWRHAKTRTLSQLHDAIALAEAAYRATVRAPELWPDAAYWETYLGDLYLALSVAQHDNDLLSDDRAAWEWWRTEEEAHDGAAFLSERQRPGDL